MNNGRFKENGGNNAGGGESFRPHYHKSVLLLARCISCGAMQVIVPSAKQVNEVLTRLASNVPVSNAELADVIAEPPLDTGLEHWSLWTLASLARHVERQKWVGYVVETRLRGDLAQLGAAGAFGHPEKLPQSGDVPDLPEWEYFFHGKGCCLTHKEKATRIDVDFTGDGKSDAIDRYFYSDFLDSSEATELPELLISKNPPFRNVWHVDIDRLGAAGCVDPQHQVRLTHLGKEIAERISPLIERLNELFLLDTESARLARVYVAVCLGDFVLAERWSASITLPKTIVAPLAEKLTLLKQERGNWLTSELKTCPGYATTYLEALCDAVPETGK